MATLQFKGKAFVQNFHLAVKYHELVPQKKKSLTDEVSLHDNLIIHGDNLKALKALLPSYAGKVKCVYIDPPYNTGNQSWRYNDNVNSPMMQEWFGKVVDADDLTRHDKWLCMMMPRLRLLRELLRDDGVIFVSIDDVESHRLRMLMDEIFGEEQWVGTITWRNVTDNNPTNIANEHEYILCYAKKKENLPTEWKSSTSKVKELLVSIGKELNKKHVRIEDLQAAYETWFKANKSQLWPLDRYKYIDKGGVYTGSQSVHNPGREGYRYDVIHPKTKKPCTEPLLGYRFPKETMAELLKQDKILFGEDHEKIVELKLYASEYEEKLSSVITLDGRVGPYELREIFPEEKKVFDNPKPSQLLVHVLGFVMGKDDICLDSCGGSGTTAHAVLELNKSDNGDRKFVLVECEEYADGLTAERVRRAIKGVKTANDAGLKAGLNGSFSYFELGEPLDVERLFDEKRMPSYSELARYVFFTATGREFEPKKLDEKRWFIGDTDEIEVYLMYKPDIEWLKKAALTLDVAKDFGKYKNKRRLVFAPTKYLDQDHLNEFKMDFAQLPFEIYRMAE